LDIAKTYKNRATNEIVRIYYVDDRETGTSLSKRTSLGHHAQGRWHYYVWLFNNDLEYFFRSPTPFLKAAVMLPIVSWYSGRTLKHACRALNSATGKLLVAFASPMSALIYLFDRANTFYKRSRDGRVT
jgi:hypothetical protein